ncbi:MAG TPA: DUF99 family protein [Methanomicrobiales archaeon]|jgi:endonuclease V-like protein UPF0215 family|nr:DUF99 family protein [Methanomicrobiales archaeon]
MHPEKRGLRALGIAESFSGRASSTMAGVVMRKDLRVDGAALASLTVGGMDATAAVLGIIGSLARRDINLVMVGGSVVAWYNILDPGEVRVRSGLPVIVVTYEESEGLEEDIRHHFPGDENRLRAYRNLGDRTPVELPTGERLFMRATGIAEEDAARVIRDFTRDGKVPEPVRVARLVARAAMRWQRAPGDRNTGG